MFKRANQRVNVKYLDRFYEISAINKVSQLWPWQIYPGYTQT